MLLGFKPRFVEPIQLGTKVFTMRNKPKRTPKVVETLHMYTGLRTKNCQLITNKEKLISIQEAFVWIKKINLLYDVTIRIDTRFLTASEQVEFMKFDGFEGQEGLIQCLKCLLTNNQE